MGATGNSRYWKHQPKKLIRAIKSGKGAAKHDILVLHFLLDKYGGYPDRWLDQDWAVCVKLLNVNSIIQNIQERERKKKRWKDKKKGSGKSRKPRKKR
ncbi:MAG: hypothetical protein ACTSSE_08475 [Candidatus Thorarchaeota archaeon]